MAPVTVDPTEIDLLDSRNFVDGIPHHWFDWLRTNSPVFFHGDRSGGPGFYAVTRYDDCAAVNRDFEHFSSGRRGTMLWELEEEAVAQQSLMMLNMDPPLHTRYRRLVNKGFTPRMVAQLEADIHQTTDEIIDSVIEKGECDFVTDIAAELPLRVIAILLGVPEEDRIKMFDWSNRMVGNEDPEYQISEEAALQASLELYAYAAELYSKKRGNPHQDLMSVLTQVEVDGEKLSDLELELFFLLLTVAGNETTRNLVSGAMTAFFQYPDQWALLVEDRSLLPSAVEEMLRYVSPVIGFRRQTASPVTIGGVEIPGDTKVNFYHASANRDETVFKDPHTFDIRRDPNPHMAFGAGGPHFCLGANLARLEIRVIYEHLLDRLPDIHLSGKVERLQSQFINGTKHLPVAFAPGQRVFT